MARRASRASREEDCETLLKALDVQPGQAVCDMGCGNGFYTLPLAKLVGDKGKVIAVDIQREMLGLLQDRARDEKLRNIKLLHGDVVDPQLEPNSCRPGADGRRLSRVLAPRANAAAIRQSLKPIGRVALVEFRAEDPNVPIKPLHKMSEGADSQRVRAQWLPARRRVRQAAVAAFDVL